jgi:hypothetical protein
LLSAERVGTNAIIRETGKSKTCVWRWQKRFAAEGFEGLLHDKTRPSRIPKLDTAIAERIVALTMEPPLAEPTHWTGVAMAEAVCLRVSSVQRIWTEPQPGLPVKKGRVEMMTLDYKRNGTSTLFAAMNVLDER